MGGRILFHFLTVIDVDRVRWDRGRPGRWQAGVWRTFHRPLLRGLDNAEKGKQPRRGVERWRGGLQGRETGLFAVVTPHFPSSL